MLAKLELLQLQKDALAQARTAQKLADGGHPPSVKTETKSGAGEDTAAAQFLGR